MGEAVSKVTPETRTQLSSIPFAQIIAMRHRLIHAYFDVDSDIVWTTVVEDLPPLLVALDAALAQAEQSRFRD
ncbi:MAG: DUF86 domain-containing protein [Bryobacterales bacterium]|nr:DUF86 domain-containing protein [Bryobacterales bacterium]